MIRSGRRNPVLRSGGSDWSSADLDAQIAPLASKIQGAVPGPGSPVALECERGVAAVIALLAVLEAGCIPVLGSSEDPPRRREQVRAVSNAAAILNGTEGEWTVSARAGVSPSRPSGAAFMTATSGTSGAPKAAAVDSEVFAAYVRDIGAAYELSADDRVLQFAPPGFDVFVEEVVPTLKHGGCVVVPPWRHAPPAREFLRVVEIEDVSIVNLPSSYWMGVAEHLRSTKRTLPGKLRLVVIGSEPASRDLAEWWVTQMPQVRLLNAYGIAELAPTSLVFDCGQLKKADAVPGALPIGLPLPHVSPMIAPNSDGSHGLLRLDVDPAVRPPDFAPFDTGDLASHEHDGFFYLHGRSDLTRLKRGGVTINAEAVAAAARDCAEVLEAAARVDRNSGAFALLVRSAHASTGIAEHLERHLEANIPSAWFPDHIEVLPVAGQPAGAKLTAQAPVVPRLGEDELVNEIRAAWAQHLDGDVEDETDFFDTGGDSIGAVRVCGAVSAVLGTKVPVQVIFANSRFGDFVAVVRTLAPQGASALS